MIDAIRLTRLRTQHSRSLIRLAVVAVAILIGLFTSPIPASTAAMPPGVASPGSIADRPASRRLTAHTGSLEQVRSRRDQPTRESPTVGGDTSRATWWQRAPHGRSDHYWIKSDLARSEARQYADHLDRIYRAMHRRLGSLPARRPEHLNVLLFQHYEDYLLTLRACFDINAIGTGGMFFVRPARDSSTAGECGDFHANGAMAIWVGDRPRQRIYSVLQHEAFHQFAYSRFGGDLPVWVNEGLAMLFGGAVFVNTDLLIDQPNPRMIASVRSAIQEQRTIPFRDMLMMDGEQWSQSNRDGSALAQYHQAWSMVQFLIYGEDGRYVSAFEQYLRLMNEGMPARTAFTQAFKTDPDDAEQFEARWKQYILNDAAPSSLATAIERIEFLAEGILELNRRGELANAGDVEIRPKSIEDLQKQLIKIDFTMPLTIHGVTAVLSAADESLFTIPTDERAREQPEFVLREPRLRLRTRRLRQLEEQNPTPPVIETRRLRPHSVRIEWRRDEEANTFSYEIIVH